MYRLDDTRAVVETLDFFTPVVDDPYWFGRIAAANAFSDVWAMGARPLFALNLVGWPVGKLPMEMLGEVLRGGAEAARLAWKAGVPNEAYNLGSLNPPPVRKLLGDLIRHAGSKSILLPTPGWAVKRTLDLLDFMNMPIMDPEQYLIADEDCLLDVSKGARDLGWVPQYRDEDMLIAAYSEYRAKKDGQAVAGAHSVPAE